MPAKERLKLKAQIEDTWVSFKKVVKMCFYPIAENQINRQEDFGIGLPHACLPCKQAPKGQGLHF